MELAVSLASGIISSLLAVTILEAYALGRRRYSQRALKTLLPNIAGRCTVVCPALPWVERSGRRGLLTYDDASAFAYAVGAANSIAITVEVASSIIPARDVMPALVCIGGPAVNRFTQSLTTEHFPGFVQHSDGDVLHYECGGHRFRHLDHETYAFVAHLSAATTGRGGPALLLWGIESIGTMAAAYYFTERVGALYKDFPKGDFLLAVRVDPRLGYKALPNRHLDLTTPARVAAPREVSEVSDAGEADDAGAALTR